MSTTLTIRTDDELRDALERRAREQRTTVSKLAREILARALTERPLGDRVGHLRGRLELERAPSEAWRRQIAARNRRR